MGGFFSAPAVAAARGVQETSSLEPGDASDHLPTAGEVVPADSVAPLKRAAEPAAGPSSSRPRCGPPGGIFAFVRGRETGANLKTRTFRSMSTFSQAFTRKVDASFHGVGAALDELDAALTANDVSVSGKAMLMSRKLL